MVRLNARALALTAALLITPAAAGCGYNTIPTKQERAEAAWADVQSQYQRRADLVPNLVATVQGAAIQERTTLTDVINARARATSVNVSADDLDNPQAFQQYQEAQGQLSGALSRLLVTVEAYPQLQANQNFLTLQSQLEGTENRIQIARRDYNEAVRDYNTTLRTFPQVIWAKTLHGGSKPMQLFTATAAAQSAPQVNFNLNAPPSNASAPGGGAPAVAPGSTPPAQ
ncbi:MULTISPECIES: LemA family protein [unclassified Brevundimonas]|uniref:LemA family protein n=1 Tax=unclassified Brevundimonas TaxID=2622653 RepID=UPI000E8454D4|nr:MULTISPECIES: LemA family protein [unclassified Brevundimonas]MCK6102877.1 LemA family protein [Brevundimonas sp. EYE_349]HBI18754.1 LemA family protein [Brevundimonas sp.]